MSKVHLVDPMSAFATWNTPEDASTSTGHLYSHVKVLERDRYCAACGRKIAAGKRVYMVYVSWGRKDHESALRPMHEKPCIPVFFFTFKEDDETTHTFSTIAFSHGVFAVETVGEPDARTLSEAQEFATWAKHCYEEARCQIVSYTILQNDVTVFTFP